MVPCRKKCRHLSGMHDTAVSRPYGNNASAFESMGRREAEREEEGWGLAPVASTQSFRSPSHRELPSHYPQNIINTTLHACGIGMVHMVVQIVFTYIFIGYSTNCSSIR